MKSTQIRKGFLNFFKERGHTIIPSMSLIPRDDPSLLFTSAGMVQFKPLWMGNIPLPYKRVASCQKCLRLSDLNNVGRTKKHHTFFEMLGNFSFGDYFKEEAIIWAWEYMTKVLSIDKRRLFISVHKEDEETFSIWHKKVGLKGELIYKLGDENNFWGPAGNSGPCGPCSEIYYDLGEEFSCSKKTCAPGCDCDRYIELWNLVFPQFNQTVSSERLPLKNWGVDTGMGFERLVAIIQNKNSNFDTDLFYPIIEEITKNIELGQTQDLRTTINVIADHIRALVFAIGDGVIPSNEERGYVLRKLLRRAVRFCHNLGIEGPFIYKLVPKVIEIFETTYPDLPLRREEITLVIKTEEERFLVTLEKGLIQLEEIYKKGKGVSKQDAFRLYDTYGFPIELTEEIAQEKGIKVDVEGFYKMLEQAKETSRAKAKFIPKGEWMILSEGPGQFVGYEKNEFETEILRYNLYDDNIEIVLRESPFYGEAGGQVGEQGEIIGKDFKLDVLDTYWHQGMIVSHCRVVHGKFIPQGVLAKVDIFRRKESARAHTSTHLLHATLRKVLGEHARQEGSFVEPGRFHFDFMHFKALNDDEITAIEDLVNKKIMETIPVEKFYTTIDEAKRMGAMALFGEKYGEKVRVVRIGDFSIELCGGIHLDNTGEIGLFKIISQESAAAGIRRVEAVVGFRLLEELQERDKTIRELSEVLGSHADLIKRAQELQLQLKEFQKLHHETRMQLARNEAEKLLARIEEEKSNLVIHRLKDYGIEGMRLIADLLRDRAKNLIGILYEEVNGKVDYLVFITPDMANKHPANVLIKEISKIIGGGGGGRDLLAEGGGGNLKKIPELIEYLKNKFKKIVVGLT